jgi:hypothetical protein
LGSRAWFLAGWKVPRDRGAACCPITEIDPDHAGSIYERDVMVHRFDERLRVLDAQGEGVVFGRLDLADGRTWRVGRIGVRTATSDVLVVDWRAPAAAPFYRATQRHPDGVARRRVVTCRGDRVLDVDDDVLDTAASDRLGLPAVGDGALMTALQRSRGHHMRDIVATIQREQDEAIRAPASGVVRIEGGPGTGKTVVALHRAAFLLYDNRERYRYAGVLVVGPTTVFSRYIERVLPSLGETSATLRSLGELADGACATRYDDEAAAVKGSLRMVRVLKAAVAAALPPPPPRVFLASLGVTVPLDRKAVERTRRDVVNAAERTGGSYDRMARTLARTVLRAYRSGLDAEAAATDGTGVDDVLDDQGFLEFLDACWPPIGPGEVLDRLADAEFTRAVARPVLDRAETDLLVASLRRPGTSTHDVALYDELAHLVGDIAAPRDRDDEDELAEPGYAEVTTFAERDRREVAPRSSDYAGYAHVIVDEAQDVTPMQWRMLARRGRRASWTIVGDPAQRSWDDEAEAARARRQATRDQAERVFTFETNYRTPAEVVALADTVLDRLDPDRPRPRAVRATGRVPEVVAATPELAPAVTRAVERLLTEVDGTVGVVASVAAAPGLAAWVEPLSDRVRCVSSLEAKGLEYDAVVVVAPAEIAGESATGLRRLYVALTRATQLLAVVVTDERDRALVVAA